ncbi:hypothetical protein FQN52_001820 [Onygenales sp. PD_12]|nr:hypothetical protein FQN52_001820 [Onygenales sp. PD_12]
MSSHRFDRGRRLRQEEVAESSHSVYSSRIPAVPSAAHTNSTTGRSQMPRPSASSRSRRGSSVSEGEDDQYRGRIPMPQYSRAPSKESRQPSGLPQPSAIVPTQTGSLIPSSNKIGLPAHQQIRTAPLAPNGLGKSEPVGVKSRNVLRRKAPSIEQYAERTRARNNTPMFGRFGSSTSLLKEEVEGGLKSGPPGITVMDDDVQNQRLQIAPASAPLPSTTKMRAKGDQTQVPRIPKELAGLVNPVNTMNLPPPTPNFTASTSSPSTRYSESPGPWSSRTSTPTSMSSYSPGIIQPTKIASRLRQPSPAISRSPLPRQATEPAPSTSTLKDATNFQPRTPRKTQTHPPVTAIKTETIERRYIEDERQNLEPPHSPPLRKSSTKFKSPIPKKEDDRTRKPAQQSRTEGAGQIKESHQGGPKNSSRLPAPSSTLPPSRPSRAGTGALELKPSPVIRSNMSALKFPGHKAHGSSESSYAKPHTTPGYHVNSSTESFQSKSSSRLPNRYASPYPASSQNSSTAKLATASKDSLGRTKTVLTKEPREPETASGTRRFGIFSRKGKPSTETNALDRETKQTRRGPAAGTGHEGYGKYAQRGRRTSVSSSNGRARSTSTGASTRKGSIASRAETEIDDFLLDRLEPVVINGGGASRTELSRTESQQSANSLAVASASNSRPSEQSSKPGGKILNSAPSTTAHHDQPAETFDSLLQKMHQNDTKSNLASRRSFRKSQLFGGHKDANLPLLINTDIPKSRPSIDSGNTSQTSFSQSSVSITVRDGQYQQTKDIKKPEKRGMWNFFQRSHQKPRKGSIPEPTSTVEVPVSISKHPTSKHVAHYALLENEQIESDSLEDIFQRIEESPPTEEDDEDDDRTQEVPLGLGLKRQHGHSVLLPSPPAALTGYSYEKTTTSPRVFFNKDIFIEEPKVDVHRRPSRLEPVGRIPHVISSREEEKKPPIPSFSRSFSRVDMPSLTSTANEQPVQFYASGRPALGAQTDILPSQEFHGGFAISEPHDSANRSHGYGPKDGEFFAFPRRKSVASGSSSSEGRMSLAAVTAVAPQPGSKLLEDEVWNEYDDFIDTVLSPKTQSKKKKPAAQQSFKLATRASRTLQAELNGATNGNGNCFLSSPSEYSSLHRSLSSARSSGSSVRLRRSMIHSALHASMTQSTPMSFKDLYGYSDKNGAEFVIHGSPLSIRRPESQSDTIREPSLPTPKNTDVDRRRNTILLDIAERDRNGAVAQTNLRSGSLMTSRWLSFGRVLFSPAHNHLKEQDQGRVLVIDGLGNDDWSFYCALTYPAATIYSLGFSGSTSVSSNPAAWQPPANHRTIHHPNLENPFPFPKGFFTAAVLRFPAACSEYGLKKTISECKRVLRPGAYMEMNVMDLDMVNMGNRTRKAVRMLKERMCMTDPSINLKPASDNIQRLLGKRGFENLSRCIVGVPVAGTVLSSSDTSSSSRSTIGTLPTPTNPYSTKSTSNISGSRKSKRPPSDDGDVSLGDLLSDPAPSESNDESIAKMVARVGRWWYTRCYEAAILPDGNPDYSIWADRRVLRECQRRGTGFRLLIAYAQKPSEPRRTASV